MFFSSFITPCSTPTKNCYLSFESIKLCFSLESLLCFTSYYYLSLVFDRISRSFVVFKKFYLTFKCVSVCVYLFKYSLTYRKYKMNKMSIYTYEGISLVYTIDIKWEVLWVLKELKNIFEFHKNHNYIVPFKSSQEIYYLRWKK